jgi:hypothetical protein
MLWITRISQMSCPDPQYAGIIGLMCTIRNETTIHLFSLELDSVSSCAWQAVFNVYRKIRQSRAVKQDELTEPDWEYAYFRGSIYLPRFNWISVADELATDPDVQTTYKRLEIGKSGSLKSLRWVEKAVPNDLQGKEVLIDIRAVGVNFKVCFFPSIHIYIHLWVLTRDLHNRALLLLWG